MERVEITYPEVRVIIDRNSEGQLEVYAVTGSSDGSTTTPVWVDSREQ